MRAQLSFELLVYFALAGIAMLSAASFLAARWPGIAVEEQGYAVSNFVNALDAEAADGAGSFYAYLPPGVCNSTQSPGELVTGSGTFYLLGNMAFAAGSLCPDGTYATLHLSYEGDEELVSR